MNVGDVLMKGDSIVEVTDVSNTGRVFITYLDDRGDPTKPLSNGGGSGWWDPSELRPVTDPLLLLRIALTMADRDLRRARAAVKDAKRRVARTTFAIDIAAPQASKSDGGD